MLTNPQPPRIHLSKGRQDGVKSAVLPAIALAHYAIFTRVPGVALIYAFACHN